MKADETELQLLMHVYNYTSKRFLDKTNLAR